MKRCACTRVISQTSRARVPFVFALYDGRDRGERLELRKCACGITLLYKPIGPKIRGLSN